MATKLINFLKERILSRPPKVAELGITRRQQRLHHHPTLPLNSQPNPITATDLFGFHASELDLNPAISTPVNSYRAASRTKAHNRSTVSTLTNHGHPTASQPQPDHPQPSAKHNSQTKPNTHNTASNVLIFPNTQP